MRIINWVNRLIGKADMTSKVIMLVEGNSDVDIKIDKCDGAEDKTAAKTISPNAHDHIYLQKGQTARISQSKKKKPK
jgi:hypothetical protein